MDPNVPGRGNLHANDPERVSFRPQAPRSIGLESSLNIAHQNSYRPQSIQSQSFHAEPSRSENITHGRNKGYQGCHQSGQSFNDSTLGTFANASLSQPISREYASSIANNTNFRSETPHISLYHRSQHNLLDANRKTSQNIHTQSRITPASEGNINSPVQIGSSWSHPEPTRSAPAWSAVNNEHVQVAQRSDLNRIREIHASRPHPNVASQTSDTAKNLAYSTRLNPQISGSSRNDVTVMQSRDGQPSQNTVYSEPFGPTTVDPSKVYDPYTEHQRQARLTAAGKRSVIGTESAGELNVPLDDEPERAAARTLMQTMNAPVEETPEQLEHQMRETFKKLRELNSKNPQLLSHMWQEERDQHLRDEAARMSPTQSSSSSNQLNSRPTGPVGSKKTFRPPASTQIRPKSTNFTTFPAKPSSSAPARPQTNVNTSTESQAPPVSSNSMALTASTNNSATSAPRTIWTPDKKAILAAVSVKLLLAMPENKEKSISTAEILGILDRNPNYLTLCLEIEALGLFVDKRQFAKAIIAAVPARRVNLTPTSHFNSTVGAHNAESEKIVLNGKSPAAPLAEVEARLLDGEPLLDTKRKMSKPPMFNGTAEVENSKPQNRHQKQAVVPHFAHNSLNQPRQNFRSANVYLDPAPKSYQSPYPLDPNDSTSLGGLEAIQNFNKKSSETSNNKMPKKVLQKRLLNVQDSSSLPLTKEEMARKRTFTDLIDLTEDLSEDDELMPPAFKVLKSNGVTPLATETNSSRQVQGDPALQSQDASLPQNHPNQHIRHLDVVKPIDRQKALRRNSYDPRTIARDVLLACGRHPEMRQLNAHLACLRDRFSRIDNFSDLATLNWELIDPGGPTPGSWHGPLPGSGLSLDVDPNDSSDNDDISGILLPAQQIIHIRGSASVGAGRIRSSGPKKKGRKTASSLPDSIHKPAAEIGRDRRFATFINTVSDRVSNSNGAQKPRPLDVTGQQNTSNPANTSYAALRAAQAARGLTPSKKGRPFGWRKQMQNTSPPASGPSSGGSKKPEGSQKQEDLLPEQQPLYPIYECKWQACNANLHNLNTLRKHVHKLHARKGLNGLYLCVWGGCGDIITETTASGQAKAKFKFIEFKELDLLKSHIETSHLKPIAWKLGDGPTGGLSDHRDSEMSEAYNSDSQGRQVTPQAVLPAAQSTMVSPTSSGKKTDEERAHETQLALQKKKSEIGPGIDRGGARLANDKRRQGFIDDEDVAEVIDEENE